MEPTDRLNLEAGHALNRVTSYLDARKRHPSFGYTKAMIRHEWGICVGIMAGIGYLNGADTTIIADAAYIGATVLDREAQFYKAVTGIKAL